MTTYGVRERVSTPWVWGAQSTYGAWVWGLPSVYGASLTSLSQSYTSLSQWTLTSFASSSKSYQVSITESLSAIWLIRSSSYTQSYFPLYYPQELDQKEYRRPLQAFRSMCYFLLLKFAAHAFCEGAKWLEILRLETLPSKLGFCQAGLSNRRPKQQGSGDSGRLDCQVATTHLASRHR